MNESSNSFKALAGLFVAFCDETELDPMQLLHMKEASKLLNAFDKSGKLNSQKEYRVAPQQTPIFNTELPIPPKGYTHQKVEATPPPLFNICVAEITLDAYQLGVFKNDISFTVLDEEIVVGGKINFRKEVSMSKKLAWCEKHLTI